MNSSAESTLPAPPNVRDRAVLISGSLLGLGAALYPKLALIAFFSCWVTLISRQRQQQLWPKLAPAALLLSVLGSAIGLVRFTLDEAIPGIQKGGNAAADKHALSGARQIVVAEDAMRRGAFIDPDGDGIGSAARIAELSDLRPLRTGSRLDPAPLSYTPEQLLDTAIGSAIESGPYLITVCLPAVDGGFSAREQDAVDEERAEREYYVYAWPRATGLGVQHAYALDQDERIWVSENQENGTLRFAGPGFPPQCNAVTDKVAGFATWQDKKPRPERPGDSAQAQH